MTKDLVRIFSVFIKELVTPALATLTPTVFELEGALETEIKDAIPISQIGEEKGSMGPNISQFSHPLALRQLSITVLGPQATMPSGVWSPSMA